MFMNTQPTIDPNNKINPNNIFSGPYGGDPMMMNGGMGPYGMNPYGGKPWKGKGKYGKKGEKEITYQGKPWKGKGKYGKKGEKEISYYWHGQKEVLIMYYYYAKTMIQKENEYLLIGNSYGKLIFI
jgi:hypothetical protein